MNDNDWWQIKAKATLVLAKLATNLTRSEKIKAVTTTIAIILSISSAIFTVLDIAVGGGSTWANYINLCIQFALSGLLCNPSIAALDNRINTMRSYVERMYSVKSSILMEGDRKSNNIHFIKRIIERTNDAECTCGLQVEQREIDDFITNENKMVAEIRINMNEFDMSHFAPRTMPELRTPPLAKSGSVESELEDLELIKQTASTQSVRTATSRNNSTKQTRTPRGTIVDVSPATVVHHSRQASLLPKPSKIDITKVDTVVHKS